ncbi:unnamed protein product, partial [Ectocarpus sp. 4 AP-2014]
LGSWLPGHPTIPSRRDVSMRLLYGALGLSFVRDAGAMNACLDPWAACPLGSTHM